MKYKKIMLILITAIFLVSIASVCAADANDTMVASEDTGEIELSSNNVMSEDNLQTSEENTTLTQANDDETVGAESGSQTLSEGEGTYYDLRDEIGSGGNKSLTKSLYSYTGGDTIEITTSGVINGNGAVIDMTGSNIRAFHVSISGVTIKDLTIKNVDFKGRGGAIYFDNTGTVENCNFTDNIAYYGAATYNGNAVNCNFIKNRAYYYVYGGETYSGGAMYQGSAVNCTFTRNHAYYGGAMYGGSAVNCTFNSNSGQCGGAMYYSSAVNCTFTYNQCSSDYGSSGGAMYYGSAVNCTFAFNEVTGEDSSGGAMYYSSAVNCTFTSNQAIGEDSTGGAMYGGSAVDCTFIGNTADDGGAIYLLGGTVSGSCFIGNSAFYDGGAIYSNWGGECINSIFINNGDAICSIRVELRTDCCWFGGTAANYMDALPISGNVKWDRILFLNATANPDTVQLLSTSEIIFKLYIYNKTSGNTSEYDNTLLPQINLTITSANGTVDGPVANLGNPIKYTATIFGDASVTATFDTVEFTIKLNNKLNPNLSVENQVVTFGENATIALNYNPNATGKVNITLTGKKGTLTYQDIDLNATIMLSNVVSADEYDVTVLYSGDENFMNATANAILTVNKANSALTINGNITFDYNTNGSATVSFTNATGFNASVVGQPNANVSVVGNTITVSGLNAGTYTLTVTTIVDANHNNVTKTSTITVNKINSTLTVGDVVFDYNSAGSTSISFNGAGGVNASVVDHLDANVSVVGNTITVSGLNAGTYTLTVTTIADANHNNVTRTSKITVNKAKTVLVADAIITTYSINKDLVITLKDANNNLLSGFVISVDWNGTKNYTTDGNGQVKIPTKGIAANIYEVLITFNGTESYVNSSNTTTVGIYKESSRVDTKPLTTDYNVHKYLVVGLKDNEGNPIRNADAFIEIHGVTYKCRSDDAGDARLIIRLNPGTYTAKITFDNVNYTGFTQYVTVIVKKLTPKLSAKKKTFKKSKKVKKYTVTLKANSKALAKVKLTLKVKGKTYKAKTNSKGKAVFKIKNLKKKGTFKAKVKFAGNTYYNAVTKTVKIKIK